MTSPALSGAQKGPFPGLLVHHPQSEGFLWLGKFEDFVSGSGIWAGAFDPPIHGRLAPCFARCLS